MYKGVDIAKHVPLSVLRSGTDVNIVDGHYRVIFASAVPAAQMTQVHDGILATAERLAGICSMKVTLFPNLTTDTTACTGAIGALEETVGGVQHDSCRSVDFVVRHGVHRAARFPQIGAEEFAHSRMMDEMLSHITGLRSRFLLRNITALHEGLHVLAHLPFTALYADATLLQLRGGKLVPFGRHTQDVLLWALDLMGLSISARLSHLDIADVSAASELSDSGQLDAVNVTLISVGEAPHAVFGRVLQPKLEELQDRMQALGVSIDSACILASWPVPAALQDQVAALQGSTDAVKLYDQRQVRKAHCLGPASLISQHAACQLAPSSSQLPPTALALLIGAAGVVCFAVCWATRRSAGKQASELIRSRNGEPAELLKRQSPMTVQSAFAKVSKDSPFAHGIARTSPGSSGGTGRSSPSKISSTSTPPSSQLRRVPAPEIAALSKRAVSDEQAEAQRLIRISRLSANLPSPNHSNGSALDIPSSPDAASYGLRPLTESIRNGNLARQESRAVASGTDLSAWRGSSLPSQFERVSGVSNSGNSRDLGLPLGLPSSSTDTQTGRSLDKSSSGKRSLEQSSFGHRMSIGEASLSRSISNSSSLAGWEIDPDDIAILTHADGSDWQLGRGSHGQVFKAQLKGSSEPIALKLITWEGSETSADVRRRALRELSHLRDCCHELIVRFYGACLWEESLAIATELMHRGTLHAALASRAITWGARAIQIAIDVAQGLSYLHSLKIAHLDLKSPNILLSRQYRAKVADVGIARALSGSYLSSVTSIGTWSWSAPELLLGSKVTVKADIYSLGVVLWELATGEQPRRGQLWPLRGGLELPPEVDRLIDSCMGADASQRPSAAEVAVRLQALLDGSVQLGSAAARAGAHSV